MVEAGAEEIPEAEILEALELAHGEIVKLYPGRSHLSPDHWAVRERPELFRRCMARDEWTARRHRELLERAPKGVNLVLKRVFVSSAQ